MPLVKLRISPLKICVIFSNGIGDGLMILPALRALCSDNKYQVLVLADGGFIDRVKLDIASAKFLELEFNREDQCRVFDVRKAAAAAASCDILISFATWTSKSMRELTLKLPNTIGHFDHFHSFIPYDSSIHACDNAFRFLSIDKGNIIDYAWGLKLPHMAVNFAKAFWSAFPKRLYRITVHIETLSNKQPDQDWLKIFMAVISREIPDHLFVFLGRRGIQGISLGKDARFVEITDIPFLFSSAILRESDYFVGVDSCFLHLADLYRIPGCALFVSTMSWEYGWHFSQTGLNFSTCSQGEEPGDDATLSAHRAIAEIRLNQQKQRGA